ncbi:MAG: S8 family peptidase [Limisphaerales bacterium]
MNHPDLAANTMAGWDVTEDEPITASAGIAHSTISAGIAAAVVNNQLGVAGMGNCTILPININGAISEMYNAIVWAADQGVRVVNLSWTGADSPVLNAAGAYLKNKSEGLLFMAGVNGVGYLDYPNHPHIYCISMTDAADNMRSRHGDHIDFAAPGWELFSTTIGSTYSSGTGTSYATPVVSGVAAVLMSINPFLSADEVIDIIKSTAIDHGTPGWDQYFGWGRIAFDAAASAAYNTLPRITQADVNNQYTTLSVDYLPNRHYSVWRTLGWNPASWDKISNIILHTNGAVLSIQAPKATGGAEFYRIEVSLP